MRVNIFKNVVAARPQETELDKIVYMMEFSQELCTRTQVYRQNLAWGHKKKVKTMKITRFPAFTPCVVLYEGKTRQNVIGLTDLCFLDIDHIDKEKKIEEVLNNLRNDKNVVLASRSVSGDGVHILIRYQQKDKETPPQRTTMSADEMQELYGKIYDHLAVVYLLRLGLEADMGAAHMEHMFIASYDPYLYYNPEAEPLMLDLDKVIKNGNVRPFTEHINGKIEKAKELLSKNRVEEAEQLLKECQDWCITISGYSNGETKEKFSLNIPSLNDLIEKINEAKEKVAKVDELLATVKENIRDRNFSEANLTLGVCYKQLKAKLDHPCKQFLEATRQRVAEVEKEMVAINRLLKQEKKDRKYKIRGEQEYKREVLYLIEKFNDLHSAFSTGKTEECYDILEAISLGLDVLPEDDNTNLLREQYQKWDAIFYEPE